MRRKILTLFLAFSILLPANASAIVDPRDTRNFMSGFQRVLLSAFQLPFQILQGTLRGPIGIGTVQGVLLGATRTVTDMVGGVFDMVASSAPYAKYAALAL